MQYKLEADRLINLDLLLCLDSLVSLITGNRAIFMYLGCYWLNCCAEARAVEDKLV